MQHRHLTSYSYGLSSIVTHHPYGHRDGATEQEPVGLLVIHAMPLREAVERYIYG